jgi:UDP-N-acetylmuramoylalanine--D-glutamate ligase
MIPAHQVNGKKYSVLGAARSGVAVAKLLKKHGARVFMSDSCDAAKLAEQLAVLKSEEIEFETGGHSARLYDADAIVISPGVPLNIPPLVEAEQRGIRITGELEVASWFCRGRIVAVTGTNGKTTTTTLIGRLFHDAKIKHAVAGNIGLAFADVADDVDESTTAILEVSSFQLDTIESFHPHISVLLNITPDHLDRYGLMMDRYIAAKSRVFEFQKPEDFLIYNYDDETTRQLVHLMAETHVHAVPFSSERKFDEGAFVEDGKLIVQMNGLRSVIIEKDQISIKGIHNLQNAMASALVAVLNNIPTPSIRATLKNFKGVEHRLEFVREFKGVTYINDSKATNVDSVWYALQAYEAPIVLMLGGRDKGNDYSRLFDLVDQHVKAIVAIGESEDIVDAEFGSRVSVTRASTMAEAVNTASKLATAGDIVMLSPACASFDWFTNYEHRGKVFKELVNGLQ